MSIVDDFVSGVQSRIVPATNKVANAGDALAQIAYDYATRSGKKSVNRFAASGTGKKLIAQVVDTPEGQAAVQNSVKQKFMPYVPFLFLGLAAIFIMGYSLKR